MNLHSRIGGRAGIRGGLLAGAAVATLLLVVPSSAADRAHTVIVADAGSVNTLDPIVSDYFQTNTITSRTYSPLITYDKALNVIGDLASDYKVAADAKSIDFTIRSGAVFHDGTPVTSKDVAYSFDRIKRLAKGVAAYISLYDSTVVTDDSHFTIKLSAPSALFLTTLSRIYIVNSKLVGANAGSDDAQAWLQNHDAGSGPYQLTSDDGGNDVVLDWFDKYWVPRGDLPQSLDFKRVDESAPKRDELAAGQIDAAGNVLDRDLEALAKVPGVTVAYGPAPGVDGIYFNPSAPGVSDVRVREAIRLAYDYKGALVGIHRNHGALPYGPLPDTLPCRPELPVVAQDLNKAKSLLAAAGQSNLTVTLRFQPVFQEQVQEATLLQSNLKSIGVTLNLEPIAFPNYLAMLHDPSQIPAMMLLSENSLFPDPGVFLTKTYMTGQVGTNRAGYSNPKVDAVLQQATVEPDGVKRCDLYKQAQTLIEADSVFMPIWWAGSVMPYRSDRIADPLKGVISVNFAPQPYTMLPGK
jgi:peptide/nickel transport system substrate-binding protein